MDIVALLFELASHRSEKEDPVWIQPGPTVGGDCMEL